MYLSDESGFFDRRTILTRRDPNFSSFRSLRLEYTPRRPAIKPDWGETVDETGKRRFPDVQSIQTRGFAVSHSFPDFAISVPLVSFNCTSLAHRALTSDEKSSGRLEQTFLSIAREFLAARSTVAGGRHFRRPRKRAIRPDLSREPRNFAGNLALVPLARVHGETPRRIRV